MSFSLFTWYGWGSDVIGAEDDDMEDNDDTDEILDESSDENDLDYGH